MIVVIHSALDAKISQIAKYECFNYLFGMLIIYKTKTLGVHAFYKHNSVHMGQMLK